MRLTCPNCAAQYEVDATLIPDDGRDVQCSNCGKTWFELPSNLVDDEPPTPVVSAPVADSLPVDPDEGAVEDWDDETKEPDSADTEAETETVEAVEEPAEDESPAQSETASGPPKRREVDPRALDILKEEADRELARRRADREESVETQSEFALTERSDNAQPSRALRARMARLRGESEPRPERSEAPEEDAYKPPQRELLPDIDEINSSLRPADADGEANDAQRRGEFRRGFGLMVAVAAVLILAYIAAPAIIRALPGTEPAMIAYVDAANDLRDFVDGIIR